MTLELFNSLLYIFKEYSNNNYIEVQCDLELTEYVFKSTIGL